MKDSGLKLVEDRAELVSTGEFLIDRKYLEKLTDSELIKIAKENLMPYKMYLWYSAKIFGPIFFVALISIRAVSAIGRSEWLIVLIPISGLLGLYSFFTFLGFIIPSIYKIIRAKKIFKQAMEELRYEAINNQVELKSLRNAFPLKVQEIVDRRKKEEEDLQELLEHASNNSL